MGSYRRFHPGFRERVMLEDGTWAEVRMVRREDARLLREGFSRLSPRARYQRFLSAKPRLTDEELRYLTEVDGESHVALGVVTWDELGREVGLGVARFFRLADMPEVAEAAITVVDDAQGKGIGRLLMDGPVQAARERGVERFEFRVLPGNQPMNRLIQALAPSEPRHEGEALCFSVPLHTSAFEGSELIRPLLSLAAQGALTLVGPTCRARLLPYTPLARPEVHAP
ncbi:GNAT family N-acetyltransferase [Cystobacter fuscus]